MVRERQKAEGRGQKDRIYLPYLLYLPHSPHPFISPLDLEKSN
jgi:hypothetical protein